ncbi:hypothetical protein [Streptomyces sp. NPDC059788]|uniref:hypothetical protein n=1 Tax=Streptomyces sp. NPDC059788 TaxID=3346948 RepID=UPI003667543A
MTRLALYTAGTKFITLIVDTAVRQIDACGHWLRFDKPAHVMPVVDLARDLVYRIPRAQNGIDEIDVSNPNALTRTHLATSDNANLLCAALSYGQNAPQQSESRLFCGSHDGQIFTFPLAPNGKTRKTDSEPAAYNVTDAQGNPIVDLAVSDDGTYAFALVQRQDGRPALVTQTFGPTPRSTYSGRPAWDTIENPRWVSLSPDRRHILVTSDKNNKYTIVDTTKNEARAYEGPAMSWAACRPVCHNKTAYYISCSYTFFDTSIRSVAAVDLQSGAWKGSADARGATLWAVGDRYLIWVDQDRGAEMLEFGDTRTDVVPVLNNCGPGKTDDAVGDRSFPPGALVDAAY